MSGGTCPYATEISQIQLKLMKGTGPALRGQHFKQTGAVDATFTVSENLPCRLKVGLFAKPQSYRTVVRFSNGASTDDRMPDIHGMAIKLFGVSGDKVLDGKEDGEQHDFILADNPVFFIRTACEYVPFMQNFAETSPFGEPPLKFIESIAKTQPEDIPVIKEFKNHLMANPLAEHYWSQVPYAFGMGDKSICRYRAVPTTCPLPGLPKSGSTGANYLRYAMAEALADNAASFDFQVQINPDTSEVVVDNPTVEWDLPWETVATIDIPSQTFNTEAQDARIEAMSFTPWHSLPEHRPVGQINEIRKAVYLASSLQRHAVAQKLEAMEEAAAQAKSA
ncbi:MAG: catalase family protein [Pseudomonadota bacterium]